MERKTRQRAVILRVFEEAQRALSPSEACALARRSVKRLSIATVYRAVQELSQAGLLRPVALPGQGLRYESSQEDHHHFFHCDDCGKVYRAPGCPPGLEKLAPAGFEVCRHEVILYGHCAQCNQSATAATTRSQRSRT